MICSICNEDIKGLVIHHKDGHPEVLYEGGNSAEPINNGRCCDKCNLTKVIPERIKKLFD